MKGGTLTLIGNPSALYRNGTHTVIADLIPGMWMLAGNAADGSDAVEISDETYKDKEYLRFEARTYRVICAPGADGTGSSSTIVKGYDTAVTLPGALFTRTGYTQTGWATTDGGAKVYELGGTYSANEAVTLYPVWTVNRYTISFDTDGGSEISFHHAGLRHASGCSGKSHKGRVHLCRLGIGHSRNDARGEYYSEGYMEGMRSFGQQKCAHLRERCDLLGLRSDACGDRPHSRKG